MANEVRDDEDLTDAYTDPPPTRKKSRTGLVRSYAMAYIPGTPKNESEDGYEPDTEKEVVYSEIEQVAAAAEVYHQENDTEAPKKKKKANKPKVRDLIKAQKDDLAIQQDNMDVSVTCYIIGIEGTSQSCLIRFVKLSLVRECHPLLS